MTLPTRLVQAGDLTFNVSITGEGPPVLLLHGFPDSLTVWRDVVPRLVAAGYQVIAFDQRGFGLSDAPIGVANYRIATIVADIPRLLAALGIKEPVQLMGHDWGAVIGWCFASAHPELVKSYVAVSVGHVQAYGRSGLEQKLVRGLYTVGFQFRGLAEAWFLRNKGSNFRRWMSTHPVIDEVIADMSRPGRLTAGMSWYRANLLPIVLARWQRCTVPTLGIWSTDDRYLTESQMTDSTRYLDAEWAYLRVENCAHWIPLEKPDVVANAALEWFSKHAN